MAMLPTCFFFFFLVLTTFCQYNETISKISAYYSAINHCNQSSLDIWSCKLCQNTSKLDNFQYLDNTTTKIIGFAGYEKDLDMIIVAFRGSVDIQNWIEDFAGKLISYTRCKNCKVHQGFLFAYQSIQRQVFQAADKLITKYPNSKILTTGHSLGAVLASLAAIDLQLTYNKIYGLYAHGCPRMAEENFGQYLNLKLNNIYRPVHYKDAVPHSPGPQKGYHHFGQQIFYDQGFTQYKVCDKSGEDPTCSNQFPKWNPLDHILYWVKMDKSVC